MYVAPAWIVPVVKGKGKPTLSWPKSQHAFTFNFLPANCKTVRKFQVALQIFTLQLAQEYNSPIVLLRGAMPDMVETLKAPPKSNVGAGPLPLRWRPFLYLLQ